MKPNPRRKAQDIQYHWNFIIIHDPSDNVYWKLAKEQAINEVQLIISIMESNFFTKIIFYKQIKFYKQVKQHIREGV